jgi:hypothetical protein
MLARADAATRAALVTHLQRTCGNRSVAGVLGGMGRGSRPVPVQRRCGAGCSCGCAADQDPNVQRAEDDGATVPLDPMALIDPRLDVGAQRALVRMSKDGPDQASAANEIAAAVKGGTLAGVFGDDLGASADLAARLGTVRWELVPDGEDAVLVEEPERLPTMVFREGARSVPARLDPALERAWHGHGTPIPTCPVEDESDEVLAQDPASGVSLGGGGACVPPSRKPKPSKPVKGRCEPNKVISGTMFADVDHLGTAAQMLAGTATALAAQNVTLDIALSGALSDGSGPINSDTALCDHVRARLGPAGITRTKSGVLIFVAPFGGPICSGHAQACFMPDFGSTCPELATSPKQLILISPFASTCPPTTLAHELGHAAGIGGHREFDPGNYMGFGCPRDHYTDASPPNDDLTKVCAAPLRF